MFKKRKYRFAVAVTACLIALMFVLFPAISGYSAGSKIEDQLASVEERLGGCATMQIECAPGEFFDLYKERTKLREQVADSREDGGVSDEEFIQGCTTGKMHCKPEELGAALERERSKKSGTE